MDVHKTIEDNVHNITALNTLTATGWVNPPGLRGTSDIIWSCLLTLAACLYTGLHLNIPPDSTSFKQFWYRLRYVPLAWLAPEFFLFRSVREFMDACWLMWTMTKKFKIQNLSSYFFIEMGGAWFGPKAPMRCLASDRPLSAVTVKRFARNGHLIKVQNSEIADRSKSTVATKLLIFVQVFWMYLQCVVRRQQNLPMSLLELHTAGIVVFCMAMYVAWFKKPLDVTRRKALGPDNVDDWDRFLCSAVAMAHYDNIPRGIYAAAVVNPVNSPRRLRVRIPDYNDIIASTDDETGQSIDNATRDEEAGLTMGCESIPLDDYTIVINEGEVLPGGISFAKRVTLNRRSLRAWHDIGECLDKLRPNKPTPLSTIIGRFHYPLVYHDVSDRSKDKVKRARNYLRLHYWYADYFLTLLVGLPYGAVYLSSWSWEFPTAGERRWWIVASVASTVALLCVTLAVDLLSYCNRRSGWERSAGIFTTLIVVTAFGLARIYLIAESFAYLRSMPIGVYHTPIWTEILPHI